MSPGAAPRGPGAGPGGEGRSVARLAMNQATVPRWSAAELIEGCARAGYGGVGLWRDRLGEEGGAALARRAERCGLAITSLCRGGWFLAAEEGERRARHEDNRRAVEEAAELGAAMLVLVCGPAPDRDLEAGRQQVVEAIAALAEHARPAGVRLAIEPMHPLYCGDRSVIVTLAQATAIARRLAPDDTVGVVVDSYHLWWDPELPGALAGAGERILGVQLADWLAPPPDPLNGRGMLGDGSIDLARFCALVDGTGYRGPVEVEIFNPEVWAQEPAEVLTLAAARYAELVAR
jgi:sugar phosphate isomerase/epimerase